MKKHTYFGWNGFSRARLEFKNGGGGEESDPLGVEESKEGEGTKDDGEKGEVRLESGDRGFRHQRRRRRCQQAHRGKKKKKKKRKERRR